MSRFPFALIRLSGLPWSEYSLDTSSILLAEAKIKQQHSDFERHKNNYINALADLHSTTRDYSLKAKLSTHLKRLHSARQPKRLTGLKGQHTADQYEHFDRLRTILLQQDKLYKEAVAHFAEDIEIFKQTVYPQLLTELAASPIWQDLALIHPGLAQRAEALSNAPWPLNKKKRQTWRTLLKVYTRALTKTSPFAHFGPVAWAGTTDTKAKVSWQLNQWLHQRLRKHLESEWAENLKYCLAPSAQLVGEEYLLVQNKLNTETVHRVASQPIFELIANVLAEESKTIESLQKELVQGTGIASESLNAFINKLIGLGFLIIDWPVKSYDPYWLQNWLNFIPDQLQNGLASLSQKLQKISDGNESITTIQIETNELCNQIFGIPEDETKLNLHKYFFANVLWPEVNLLPEWSTHLEKPTQLLQQLLNFLFINSDQASINDFFQHHYMGKKVSLLEFHEHYHKSKPFDLKNIYESATILQYSFLDLIKQTVRQGKEGLEIDLNVIADYLEKNRTKPCHNWRGIIVQQGSGQLYLTHSFLGHGKMISRFLTTSDSQITKAIKNENEQYPAIVAEVVDDNFFTVNLHPSLTASNVDWLHNSSNDDQLKIGDLYIEQVDQELSLWHEKSGRQVCPMNYGFEALERRSPLFQTIIGLGSVVTDVAPLRKILKAAFSKTKEDVKSWPRISLDQGLVLLRKGWEIKSSLLHLDKAWEQKEHPWQSLRRIQTQFNLPDQLYLKVVEGKSEQERGDEYKPQYIDFTNPLYLEIWKGIIKQNDQLIMLEEVFPKVQKSNDPYSDHVQEWVIEYKL